MLVLFYILLIHSASTQRACDLHYNERSAVQVVTQTTIGLPLVTENKESTVKRDPIELRGEIVKKGYD